MAVKGVDRQLGDSSVVDKTYNISYYIKKKKNITYFFGLTIIWKCSCEEVKTPRLSAAHSSFVVRSSFMSSGQSNNVICWYSSNNLDATGSSNKSLRVAFRPWFSLSNVCLQRPSSAVKLAFFALTSSVKTSSMLCFASAASIC